jgi:hypothetical protein
MAESPNDVVPVQTKHFCRADPAYAAGVVKALEALV